MVSLPRSTATFGLSVTRAAISLHLGLGCASPLRQERHINGSLMGLCRRRSSQEIVSNNAQSISLSHNVSLQSDAGFPISPLCGTKREFCSRCNVVTSSCCILGIRWDIKGCVRSDVDVLAECKESARVRTRSPDSLVLSIARQLAVETQGRQSLRLSAGGRGKFAGRNTSERRYSIVISTSDHADSAGDFPGASMSLGGEACYGSGAQRGKIRSAGTV